MIYKIEIDKPVKVKTILTGKIKDDKIFVTKAVTSVQGKDFVDTKSIMKSYKGENIYDCTLIEYGHEFDAIYDVHGRSILK